MEIRMRSKVRTAPEQIEGIVAHLRRNRTDGKSVEQIRGEMEAAAALWPEVPGVRVMPVRAGGLTAEWLMPEAPVPVPSETRPELGSELGAEDGKRAVLYFHGGGFTSGTCRFYRSLASEIALASGVPVLTVEYRLAPEHPYPAANEDCLAAYRWLADEGFPPEGIVFGGDSVGASLALMTLLTLRSSGEALPAGAFLLSPHGDLAKPDGDSYRSRADRDPTGSLEGNRRLFEAYWGRNAGEPPALLSPMRMDLSGLPPLLIQAGDREVLLSDAERLARYAREAGTEAHLEVWEDMWCVFQLLVHMLPEAREAIGRIGGFVRSRLGMA